jgi:hypothetical protein
MQQAAFLKYLSGKIPAVNRLAKKQPLRLLVSLSPSVAASIVIGDSTLPF